MAQSVESLLPAGAPPAWAEITGTVDDPEDMRWHRDVETLVGFVAPAACAAIATVGCGWAYGLPGEPHERVPLFAPGERRQARVVCLMTRSGDMAGYLREGSAILVNEPPTIGRIPDCIRRCFRLPTPPPEEPTDGLLASMWLNNVCGAAGRATRPLTWPDVAGLHPVMQIAADNGVTVPMGQLVRILRVASDAWSWTYLAQQAASPGWLANLLPPDRGRLDGRRNAVTVAAELVLPHRPAPGPGHPSGRSRRGQKTATHPGSVGSAPGAPDVGIHRRPGMTGGRPVDRRQPLCAMSDRMPVCVPSLHTMAPKSGPRIRSAPASRAGLPPDRPAGRPTRRPGGPRRPDGP